jgi:hypothetical protein
LFDACAGFVEGFGKEGRLVFLVGLVGDHGGNATQACCGAIGLARITFVADRDARRDVRSDIEQGLEMGCIRRLTAGQVEGDDVAGTIRFGVDFGREPAAGLSVILCAGP